jgi:hypothetical protein
MPVQANVTGSLSHFLCNAAYPFGFDDVNSNVPQSSNIFRVMTGAYGRTGKELVKGSTQLSPKIKYHMIAHIPDPEALVHTFIQLIGIILRIGQNKKTCWDRIDFF